MNKKIKILLAEDEPSLGQIIKESLETRNFEVLLCEDGEIAYKTYKTENPLLLVLDVMMPKKDGFTLAKEIREENLDIPIIFLTAKSQTDDVVEGFNLGGNDYLKKQTLQLNDTIETLTHREAQLLFYLIKNKNQVLERSFVLKKLWGDDDFFNARSMDVFITKLRKKLKNDTSIQIINIRGYGYKLIY